MRVDITVAVCVVIDDRDDAKEAAQSRGPLDHLIGRMRREMQYGRDSVKWRVVDGAEVAC
jgi:hypothetical protein